MLLAAAQALLWLAISLWTGPVCAHPQCLNFQPPYGDSQASYCSEYKDYGCCWRVTDRRARKTVDFLVDVMKRRNDPLLEQCEPYLRNISCLPCNPYAAHLFDVEENDVKRVFPWLCHDYCVDAYRHCHSVLLRMFKLQHADFGISKTPASPEALEQDAQTFCSQVIAEESVYCYPEILNGPQIPGVDPEDELSGDLGCICGERVASGLRNPVVATHSGDGTGRLFIAEQIGVIQVLTVDNTLLPQPFLDISGDVLTSSRAGDERGLLGLAFHPDYSSNGKLYVYYSTSVSGEHWSRVSEFTVSTSNPNVVNASSERELWSVSQPAGNHNGGQILFHDGYLLIFLGDGGGAGDTFRNALNKATWLGSALRIDVNQPDPSRQTSYSIPPDNPFLDQPSTLPETFAYGLRNPWRCSVDTGDRVTGEGRGRIFCGDVGQNQYEEVDIIVSGGNYGWRAYEGNSCFVSSLCNDESLGPFIFPIDAYSHSEVGVSITGGYVYRGCLYPNLRGLYIYGDYGSGRLLVLRQGEDGGWQRSNLCMGDSNTCTGDLVGEERERFVLSFGEDQDGELYILTTSFASPTAPAGAVYHIVDPARRETPTQCSTLRTF